MTQEYLGHMPPPPLTPKLKGRKSKFPNVASRKKLKLNKIVASGPRKEDIPAGMCKPWPTNHIHPQDSYERHPAQNVNSLKTLWEKGVGAVFYHSVVHSWELDFVDNNATL